MVVWGKKKQKQQKKTILSKKASNTLIGSSFPWFSSIVLVLIFVIKCIKTLNGLSSTPYGVGHQNLTTFCQTENLSISEF